MTMSDGTSANEPKRRRRLGRPLLLAFMVGLVAGIAGTIIVPGLVRPRLPEVLAGEGVPFAGVVRAKQAQTDRLLLTLLTADGAILATFTERVLELGLLIQEGDSVTLELREYAPFVDDPTISRVMPAPPLSETLGAANTEATETVGEAGTGGTDTAITGPDTGIPPDSIR